MITIVDYGLGNVRAFLNVYKRLNIEACAVQTAAELEAATRVILPGVGAFDHAMTRLVASGMRATLEHLALERQVPVLGVCVGMQMLADSSDEGRLPGLGWVPGRVRAFASWEGTRKLPVPHMGWNDVTPYKPSGLFEGLEVEGRFYFLHSFFFDCADPADALAGCHYGAEFSCAVRRGRVFGVQFHPEKSHRFGMRLLQNFAGI